MTLEKYIHNEATRLIKRHERNMRGAADEARRRSDRSTNKYPPLKTQRPEWWSADQGFDPYHVRRRAGVIGHSVWKALRRGEYEPRPPARVTIMRDDGRPRELSVFQVADSAISRMVFESVLRKNTARLSGRAYAYRKDLSAQDAIQYVKSEWAGRNRLFVAEFDFSSFFSDLSHDHLDRMLREQRLLMSPDEKQISRAFMRTAPCPLETYSVAWPERSSKGIPQGTSISLILANLAASDLDRQLERLKVGFVRYADDTLVWSTDYSSICSAVEFMADHASRMGVAFNKVKSPGISLLVPRDWLHDGEIRTVRSVPFLGYSIGLDHCSLKHSSESRIRERCLTLIYDNLLREPLQQSQNLDRISAELDRDYVRLLSQLRRYLYGNLSETQVMRYQRGDIPFRHFYGVMSAYPMLDDIDQLRRLDGWLANQIVLALKKRTQLVEQQRGTPLPSPGPLPHGCTVSELLSAEPRISQSNGRPVNVALPSFRRIASVVARATDVHGSAVATEPPVGPSNPRRARPQDPGA